MRLRRGAPRSARPGRRARPARRAAPVLAHRGRPRFPGGELEGLSVDSEGRVRLAPAARPLYDPEAPVRLVPRPRREGRPLRRHRQRRQGLRDRGRQGHGALRRRASSRSTRWPWGPTAASTPAPRPTARSTRSTRPARRRRFFDPADKYIWALAFDAQGASWSPPAREGTLYRVDKDGKARDAPRRPPRPTSPRSPWPATATSTRAARPAASSIASTRGAGVRAARLPLPRGQGAGRRRRRHALRRGHRRRASEDDAARPAAAGHAADDAARRRRGHRDRELRDRAPRPRPRRPSRRRAASPRARAPRRAPLLRIAGLGRGRHALVLVRRRCPTSLRLTPRAACWSGTGRQGQGLPRRATTAPGRWSRRFPAEQVTGIVATAPASRRARHVEPGQGPRRSKRQPRRRGTFVSKRQGHRDGLASWGRLRWEAHGPAGTEVQVADAQRQHQHARRDLVRLVGAYTRPDGDRR